MSMYAKVARLVELLKAETDTDRLVWKGDMVIGFYAASRDGHEYSVCAPGAGTALDVDGVEVLQGGVAQLLDLITSIRRQQDRLHPPMHIQPPPTKASSEVEWAVDEALASFGK